MMKAAWIVLGIILGASLYPIMIEAQDYYGKFPPTSAYSMFHLNDTIDNQNLSFNGSSYDSTIHIITDGSIVFSKTQGLCPTC